MKKRIIALLVSILIISFTACGEGDKPGEAPATSGLGSGAATAAPETPQAAAATGQNMSITLEDRDWTIAGFELTERDE